MQDFEGYLNRVFKFLSYRPRSEKEIRDYLNKKKAPEDIIEKLIGHLTELKFLNDEDFARWWFEQRTVGRPRSHRVIKMELKQKGIAPEIVEKIMTQKDEPIQDDLTSAKKLVRKKITRMRHLEKQELYQKLGGFLARKGFDWDTIKQAIDDSFKNEV